MVSAKKTASPAKRKKNAWMHEPREWVLYAMTPDATGYTWKQLLEDQKKAAQAEGGGDGGGKGGKKKPVRVYLGITSIGLKARRQQHMTDAHERRSTCPVHKEMRRMGKRREWYIHALKTLKDTTYRQAKQREKTTLATYATFPGVRLLNRGTLGCE